MGNVMTGRQAYGEYDTASEKQSDHYDDPLAELARIVSEGDEFLRQQRQDAQNPSDASTDYGQTSENSEAGDYQSQSYDSVSDQTAPPDSGDFNQNSTTEPALESENYGAETHAVDTYGRDEPIARTISGTDHGAADNEFRDPLSERPEVFVPGSEPGPDALYSDAYPASEVGAPTVQIHLDPQDLMEPSFDAVNSTADAADQHGLSAEAGPAYADEYDDAAVWPQDDSYGLDSNAPVAPASHETGYDFAVETGHAPVQADDHGYGVGNEGDYVGVAPPIASEDDYGTGVPPGDEGVTSRSLGFKAIAAAMALILVGGGGLFIYRSIGGGGSSGAPQVIKADTEPFKQRVAESAKGTSASTPGAGVYNRLSGKQQSDKSQERIVVGKEQPVNVARNGGLRGAAVSNSSLPKPVKTIVVKPDGTFVSRPEPQVGAGAKPNKSTQAVTSQSGNGSATNSDKPAVKTKSAARVVATSPIRTVTAARPKQPPTGEQATAPAKQTVAAPQQPPSAAKVTVVASPTAGASPADTIRQAEPSATIGAPSGVSTGQGNQAANQGVAVAITPRAKPARPSNANQSRTFVADQQSTAATQPAAPNNATSAAAGSQVAAVQASPAPATRTGGYIVQVSSQRSQKQALTAFADLQRRYPTLLGDKKPLIQKADLGDRGLYYRVRLGPYEKRAATKLCGQLTSAGGECFVRRN